VFERFAFAARGQRFFPNVGFLGNRDAKEAVGMFEGERAWDKRADEFSFL
jgi:hypothetical protein